MALGLAAPAFGPNAAVNQIRWIALYPLAALGLWMWRRIDRIEAWLFLPLGWAALSILWAPDRGNAVLHLTHAAALFAAFLLARRMELRYGVVLAFVCVVAYQFFDNKGWFGNENWAAEFILIASPLILWRWGIPLVVLGLLSILMTSTHLHWYVAGVWVSGVLMVLFTRNWIEKVVFGVLLAAFGLAMVEGTVLEISVYHRFELWWNSLHAWWASPLWGHGIGSFDYVYDSFREQHYLWRGMTIFERPSQFAGAAHNLPVQILVELGLIGMLVMATSALVVIRSLPVDLAALALVIAAALSLVGFPEQNPQTGLLIAIALGCGLRAGRYSG